MGPSKWALLCGGDFYFHGTARNNKGKRLTFPNLRGCVQDVKAIYDLLIAIGVSSANVSRLTATCGEGRPVEEGELWPTRANIVRELSRIIDTASSGDLVYIHYSGHGIRRDAAPPDTDDDSMAGMALVMTDVLRGGPYLTGRHLGAYIRKMVEKGLRVTLVLDSCYSGRAIRVSEITPRTLPDQYDDSSLPSDNQADTAADMISTTSSHRNTAAVEKNWWSNPTGCTILTACGPQELAGERRFGGSDFTHGVFSYCILRLLRGWRGSALPSHARVLQNVRIQARKIPVRQSPRLIGDGNYEFFGATTYVERRSCHVLAMRDGEIDLDVGSVQGVVVGALYDIFQRPFDSDYEEDDLWLQAKVTSVSLFQSTAVLLHGRLIADDGREWFAVLRQWALPNTSKVSFLTGDQELHAKLKNKLAAYLGLELIEAATSDVDFTVKVDRECTYEIFQDGFRLPRLPRISANDESGIEKLAYTLSHIARYQALRKLVQQPSKGLQPGHFQLDISPDPSSMSNASKDDIIVEEGAKLGVSLTYKGPLQVVFGSLFCFTASWGISKIDPGVEEGQLSNLGTPSISISDLEMTMEIPDKSRDDDPSDITDVFVMLASTVDHISWDEICLDSLPVDGTVGELLVSANKGNLEQRNASVVKRKSGEPGWMALQRVVHTYPKAASTSGNRPALGVQCSSAFVA